jgi:hypothetical protein
MDTKRTQLKLGKMTNKEMAEWFGVALTSYTQRKRKGTAYLNQLEDYCAFEEIRGGINVLEIYKSEYIPKKSKVDKAMRELAETWSSQPDGFSTATYLVGAFLVDHEDEPGYEVFYEYSPQTLIDKVSEVKKELWGNGYTKRHGTRGWSTRVMGVKDKDDIPRLMTDEEHDLRRKLYKDYVLPKTDEQIDKDMQEYLEGEQKTRDNNFKRLFDIYKQKTGLIIIMGTQCQDGIIWDEEFTFE